MLLTPPLRPAHANAAQLISASASSSSSSPAETSICDLSQADVHAVTLSAPAPLQALAVLGQDTSTGSTTRGRASGVAGGSCTELLGAGSDGQLYWLQLPAAAASGPVQAKTGAHQLSLTVVSKAVLPWPAAALAVSPESQEVLLAGYGGAVLSLPTAPTAAAAVLTASSAVGGSAAEAVTADGTAAAVLAWSGDASWSAAAGADGSLLVYTNGKGLGPEWTCST
jgi:hypothetical protein